MPKPRKSIIELEFFPPQRSALWLASGHWHQREGSSQIFGALYNLPSNPKVTFKARIEVSHLETYASLFQDYEVCGGDLVPSQPPAPEYRQSRLKLINPGSWAQRSSNLHIRIEQDEIPDFYTDLV